MISGTSVTVARGYEFPAGTAIDLDDLRAAAKPTVTVTPTYANTQLSGTTPTVDVGAGPVYYITLTGNTTFSFTNYGDSDYYGKEVAVVVTQAAGSSYTVTWPTSSPTLKWPNGEAPPMETTVNSVVVYRFINYAGVLAAWASNDRLAAGMLYVSTPASTAIGTPGTFYKAAGTTTLESVSRGFDMPADNRLRFTGANTSLFKVCVHATLECGTSNQEADIRLAKNGTELASSQTGTELVALNKEYFVSSSCVCELGNNDYIELWVTNATASNAITVQHAVITAICVN